MANIPDDFVNYKSTTVWSKETVPKTFLHDHNTRAGVYGRICVLSGSLKFTGFVERRGEVDQEVIIAPGEFAVATPQYWHKVEFLGDDTQFKIEFFAQKDSDIVAQSLSERD
ncbi:MAG: DUF1971 domain-containing protein [Algicola sp.]|nr:DUF1971 domain-containing protein [Algicola sp.]